METFKQIGLFTVTFAILSYCCKENVTNAGYLCVGLIKKEVIMVSIQLNENRHNLLIGVVMVIVAILFLLYMGSSMVSSTKAFWSI